MKNKQLTIPIFVLFVVTAAMIALNAQEELPPIVNPPPGNFVYLIDPVRASESLVTPAKVQTHLNARAYDDWNRFIQSEAWVDGVIIHRSMMNAVDRGWLSNAYRQGIVIAGIRMTGPEIAQLVGDPCIGADNFAADIVDAYVIVSFEVAGSPDDIAKVLKARSDFCLSGTQVDSIAVSSEPGHISGRGSTDALNSERSYNHFTHLFVSHLEDRRG